MLSFLQFVHENVLNEAALSKEEWKKHDYKYAIAVVTKLIGGGSVDLVGTNKSVASGEVLKKSDFENLSLEKILKILNSGSVPEKESTFKLFNDACKKSKARGNIIGRIWKTPFSGKEGTVGKDYTERQERGIVAALNNLVKEFPSKNIVIVDKDTGASVVSGVTGAIKVEGKNKFGNEMYPDVKIFTRRKEVNLSCKGNVAPSIAGGGLDGLLSVDSAYIRKVIGNMYKDHVNSYKKNPEKWVWKDMYVELSQDFVRKAYIGNEDLGGKISYMYIGNMDVEYTMHMSGDNKTLYVTFTNAKFLSIEQMMAAHKKIFLRVRRRKQENSIFSDKFDSKYNLPEFTVIKKNGQLSNNRRFVLTFK